jgi:hypothetical protein
VDGKELLSAYAKYAIAVNPPNLLAGGIAEREGEIALSGKKGDDLNGSVKRRLLSDINRFFWDNPKDVDDTRLVFEATESDAAYSEKKDGTAKLVLKIRVELASQPPEARCC